MSDRTHVAEIEEHKVKTGETLDSVATANGLTKDDLAKFNFGTADPAQLNRHLHDDVGCTRRDAGGNFIFDDNDDPGIILVPKPLKLSGLATSQQHTLRVRELSTSRNFHKCICIPGLTFEFDKSFIRPSIVNHLHRLDAALQKFPDAKLIVFGHTDRVGSEQYNKELSERRAKSAYAFVTDQAAVWESLYNEEHWGTKVIQEILLDLGHDPGPIDGAMGPKTQAAMREFQGLPAGAPVSNDAAFRAKLFTAYMTGKHDVHVSDEQFFAPKFMGCGEFNPLVEPNANELANRSPGNEPNRRVVFYLFRRPPSTIPCKLRVLAPCKTEIAKPGERKNPLHKCAFYDGIAKECNCEQRIDEIRIRLFDWLGKALPGAPYKLTLGGKELPRTTADESGDIILHDVLPGTCHVQWSRPDSMRTASPPAAAPGDIDFINADGSTRKVTLEQAEEPEFEFENDVFINLPEVADGPASGVPAMDEQGARKRLGNMGYSTAESLDNNIRAFQRDCGDEETGLLAHAEPKLRERHDEQCQPPGLSSRA